MAFPAAYQAHVLVRLNGVMERRSVPMGKMKSNVLDCMDPTFYFKPTHPSIQDGGPCVWMTGMTTMGKQHAGILAIA